MNLRTAEILFKDQVAGTLEETAGGGTRFIYAPKWQTQIACTLSILQREHEWAQGVHPFFQHLGPEGWLRETQARVAHIAEEDDFGLLLRYGADCIGAVGVRRPPGEEGEDIETVTEITAKSRTDYFRCPEKASGHQTRKRLCPRRADRSCTLHR